MFLTIVLILFLTALGYQLGLYLYLGLKLIAYQEPSENLYIPKNQVMPPPVSVIICAHNEKENLQALLPMLYSQLYKNFQIVIVDDASSDGTIDFLREEEKNHPNLKVVWIKYRPKHVQSKKFALTMGIKAAQHEKLVLTDADCRPDSDYWLTGMASKLENEVEFVLGYSPYQMDKGLLNHFIRFETLHTGFLYISAALAGHPYMGVGRNLAYRKSYFLKKKGFYRIHHLVGGDDDLFVNRHACGSNTKVSIHKNTLMHSIPKKNWQAFYRQKVRHLGIGKYYKRKDKIWIGLLSISSVLLWICFPVLLFHENERYYAIIGFLLRWGLLFAVFISAGKKLNDPINWVLLPIFDVLYVIYYMIIGTKALSTKNTRWI